MVLAHALRMINIIVGGFYGDEGKGKIVGYLASSDDMDVVVRAGGGPQAGHTVTAGKAVTQIPSGFIHPRARLLIGRGTVIDPKTVLKEIQQYGVGDRIGIDYGCTIIESGHRAKEQELVLRIGSVGTGTGPARVDRVLRSGKLTRDVDALKPYLVDVAQELEEAMRKQSRILIEGVQGYGLSLLNHRFYPYVTSQDTTASQFAADAGIGPRAVDEVTVIYKAYISRVGKGPLATEWNEEERTRRGIEEHGTVSGRPRRLGAFDRDLAVESFLRNTGTQAAITCLDRLFSGNTNVRSFDRLTSDARKFVEEVDMLLRKNAPSSLGVTLISTGPDLEATIDMRKHPIAG